MADRMLPFRYNTRQRIQPIGQQVYNVGFATNTNNGQKLTFEVPRVGFLAGFFVQLIGNLTRAGGDTGTFSPRMFNILNRLQVNINIGAAAIVDISGYGLYLENHTRFFNYGADLGGSQVPGTNALNSALTADPSTFLGTDAAPSVAQGFAMAWYVPIAANDGDNFNMGLINCQAPEVRVTLEVSTASNVGTLFTTGAVVAGTQVLSNINVTYLYYEVPNPNAVMFPPLMMHRTLEERTPYSNTGDVTYLVPRQGNLLALLHNLIVNGDNSPLNVFSIIRVNKTDDVYRESKFVNSFLSRTRYAHRLPVGATIHDFWYSEGMPVSGDFRDVIDTEAISTLESVITVDASAVLGVGNNFIDTTRRIIQVLQV